MATKQDLARSAWPVLVAFARARSYRKSSEIGAKPVVQYLIRH
jgi:hypothetical protein